MLDNLPIGLISKVPTPAAFRLRAEPAQHLGAGQQGMTVCFVGEGGTLKPDGPVAPAALQLLQGAGRRQIGQGPLRCSPAVGQDWGDI